MSSSVGTVRPTPSTLDQAEGSKRRLWQVQLPGDAVSVADPLHVSLNRRRFKDKNMQQFKVLQRTLRV
ncbi:hypothetical protein EHS39_27185 [Ensifer sp. MPMI2T]|nr:hypothetical protein EHS39_27185 [Ensifer sp. MPMI2T]